MTGKGCYRYAIDSRDVDFSGRATLAAMCHYILEAAGEDADLNGFGVRDLNLDNTTWVLSRMAVEFARLPRQGEHFIVRTWVNEVSRVMTTRNMEVTDSDGVRIAAAVTQWAIIDTEKRTAVDIRGRFDYDGVVTDEPCPADRPARMGAVAPAETMQHRVVYGDIDFNHHMNSLRYIALMADMLPMDYFTQREIARLDIAFMHEARYGQVLTVGCEQRGGESCFEITNDEGQSICKASMKWREN
ncbi:acyl-ACP thioesterase [Alistipes sp. OttesenSCG-928-B03]|nr:acyl-ACP thioesterase [Alistipes sp. OttesenSCG-928-B03]